MCNDEINRQPIALISVSQRLNSVCSENGCAVCTPSRLITANTGSLKKCKEKNPLCWVKYRHDLCDRNEWSGISAMARFHHNDEWWIEFTRVCSKNFKRKIQIKFSEAFHLFHRLAYDFFVVSISAAALPSFRHDILIRITTLWRRLMRVSNIAYVHFVCTYFDVFRWIRARIMLLFCSARFFFFFFLLQAKRKIPFTTPIRTSHCHT